MLRMFIYIWIIEVGGLNCRGEMGFCSEDCRWEQMMMNDEQMEKFGGSDQQTLKPFACSLSPCSATPFIFMPRVAAV